MKLTDLKPRFWAEEGRSGQGVLFDCPCCVGRPIEKRMRIAVAFSNPIDGGTVFPIRDMRKLWGCLVWNVGDSGHPPIIPPGVHWKRVGETFDGLTIRPSVDCSPAGHWHGFVIEGSIR